MAESSHQIADMDDVGDFSSWRWRLPSRTNRVVDCDRNARFLLADWATNERVAGGHWNKVGEITTISLLSFMFVWGRSTWIHQGHYLPVLFPASWLVRDGDCVSPASVNEVSIFSSCALVISTSAAWSSSSSSSSLLLLVSFCPFSWLSGCTTCSREKDQR